MSKKHSEFMEEEGSDLYELLKKMSPAASPYQHIKIFIAESNAIEGVNDVEEVKIGFDAYLSIAQITLKHILLLHKKLMGNLAPDIGGKIRTQVVYVGGRACSDKDIDKRLRSLCKKAPRNAMEALQWHIEFEHIHPFLDGNGRTGRLIYYRQCKDIGVVPMMFRAKDRRGYYSLFS